jgi:hypothetical protein
MIDFREAAGAGFRIGVILLCAALLAIAVWSSRAHGTWKPEYEYAPPDVRDWYAKAELTPEAQGRFPFKSCCAHSDVVKTQFRVDRTDGGDAWFYWKDEHWQRVPPDIIHWGERAPDNQPTLFVYRGQETCFWPGEGGI